MRYAVVESGGKQYRAVEGSTIEVDRLAHETGKKFDFERVLLMADGDTFMVGAPVVDGIKVSATVLEHFKGPKVISFKYRPKKRIRVKGGHRHHYTRLMIDFIGKPGEERKIEKPAVKKETKVEKVEAQEAPKAEKQAKAKKEAAPKSAVKKTEKASEKKPSTTKKSSKK